MANKRQAFTVRLNQDAYNMILGQPKSMRIEIGDSSSFMVIGDRPFELNLRKELSAVQVYKKHTRLDDDNRIRYVGDITHVGQMKQTLSEDDKKRARSRTAQVEKEKNAKRIELLDVPGIPTPTKLHGNNNATPTAVPLKSSPTKRSNLLSPSAKNNASPSKYLSSTKNTSSSSPAPHINGNGVVSRLEGAALANLRERLIHLLALDPRPNDQLINMLKVASVDLLPLLKKVAVFTNSTWCLRPEVFKEIRIWEWTRYDDKERASVRKKAEDAYDFLKLPRTAPERANLLPRKPRRPSPKLVPPPSQHTPTLGNNTTLKDDPMTTNGVSHINHSSTLSSSSSSLSNIKSTNSNDIYNNDNINTNTKHGRMEKDDHSSLKMPTVKKRKIKMEKSTKPRSTASLEPIIATNGIIPSPSKPHHSSSPSNPVPTKKQRTEIKKPKIPEVPRMTATETTTTMHDNDVISSTDMDDDDDNDREINGRHNKNSTKAYIPPTIHTQLDFDLLCKEHQETQQDYIRFKRNFVQNHPIYIQALAAVNEQDKKLFERKLKAYYKSKGGDMNKWRLLMQLSRRFNGTHAKINVMWDTIEKAYRQKKFTLRLYRRQPSHHSSSSSASSSPPPRPRPTSSKVIKKSLVHR